MIPDAADGRPWPVDPAPSVALHPLPIPELEVPVGPDEVAATLTSFAGPADADGHVPAPVTDDDRHRYGALLDRAAERGLLSPEEYEVRLGELAEATDLDQVRIIVTDLPLFTAPPASTKLRSKNAMMAPGFGMPPPAHRRRSSPWVLLGILVVVLLASLVLFSVYAEHVVHTHNAGVVGVAAALRVPMPLL
jgi:hypothetical protein